MCTGTHPFIPAPNTAKVSMRMTQDNQHVENVFWVRHNSGLTEADLELIATQVAADYNASFKTQQANDVFGVEILVEDWTTEGGARFLDTSISGLQGTNGLALPNNASFAVKFTGGTRGRSTNGRAFWVGLTEGDVSENTVSTSRATDIVLAWATLFDDLRDNDFDPVIVSFCGDNVWRTEALITSIIAVSAVDRTVDSQRRRLPGRGR